MDTSKHSSFIFSSKENRIFFAKAAALLLGFLCFAFFVVMPQYTGSFNASLTDKVERLKSLEGPKIVFLGFSDMAFGLRSKTVQEELGIQTVNAALHGGLSNTFAEELARVNVVQGDVYVLEHLDYADETTWGQSFNPVLLWSTIENHWQLWPLMWKEEDGKAVRPYADMLESYPSYLKNCLNHFIQNSGNRSGGAYSRISFNENGDNVSERHGTVLQPDDPEFWGQDAPKLGENTTARINELAHWLQERGAELVLICPPVAFGAHSPPLEDYEATQRGLAEALDCPVISEYKNYMFGYEYFYDGRNHLNSEGAALYTQQVIKDLRTWMEESGYQLPG